MANITKQTDSVTVMSSRGSPGTAMMSASRPSVSRPRSSTLISSAATVVAAHFAAQATGGDMELRKKAKWQLTRRLYERGYTRTDILELFRLIDWLLVLPTGLAVAFHEELITFEREKTMPHLTSVEIIGLEKGLEKGRQEGRQADIIELPEARFGMVPEPIMQRVKRVREEAVLRRLLRQAALLPSLEGFVSELP